MRPHNALNGTAASSEVLVVSHSPQSHHCRDVSADRHVGDPRRRTGQHELREQNLPERADLVAGLQNCGPGCHAPRRTRPASRRPRARPSKVRNFRGVEGVMNADSEVSPAALDGCDPDELGQLTATVEQVLPAIEKFWRYDGRDDAAGRRPGWLARLDVPLPEAGGGIGAVAADLADIVIPNGARVGEPGWSGFVTTG